MPTGPNGVAFFPAYIECAIVYESALDNPQLRATDEAKSLSNDLRLRLEIVYMSRANPIRMAPSKLVSFGE